MQPELFQEIQAQAPSRRFQVPLFPHRFLRVRLAYEDVIFFSLSLVLILLAGFCLGVERGRWLVDASISTQTPAVAKEQLSVIPVAIPPAALVVQKKPEDSTLAKLEQTGQYVIQLASYVDTKAAKAEMERLHRRGFNALVVRQGKYLELRVIGYRSRTEALSSLVVLKKLYHDGFVKRLSPSS